MLRSFRLVSAILPVLGLLSLLNAGAQAPTAPPMMVQAPYISVGAGNIVAGVSSSSKAAACTGYANAGGSNYGDGCTASQVGVSTPWGVTADAWGNVYFSDEGHLEVRVIYAGATTVNGVANPATAMIPAANTTLSIPGTLAAGNVYALAGGLTVAGSSGFTCNGGGTALSVNGSGCPAADSYIKGPYGPAVDSAGNVFIPDKSNSLIYVVIANASSKAAQLVTLENPTVTSPKVGYIYAIVNGGGGYADGVLALSGKVHGPFGIAVDANENLYIADGTNNLVRMVNGPGVTNSSGTSGICPSNSCAPGYIHAIAGLYAACNSTSCTGLAAAPSANVSPLGTGFLGPMGIAVDSSGNIYIGDNSTSTTTVPSTVRVIYAGGTNNPVANLICIENSAASYCGATPSLTAGYVYTIAGNGNAGTTAKGAGLLATATGVALDRIQGLGLDSHNNLYIMDYGSHSELAEINANTGILTFLSADGLPTSGTAYSGSGVYCTTGTSSGSGPMTLDKYGDGCPAPQNFTSNAEGNIGIDPSGNIYYADSGNGLIRKLSFNNSFPATTVGNTTATLNLAFVLFTGSTGSTVTSGTLADSVSTQGITSGSEFHNAGTGDSCSGSTTLAPFTSSSTNVPFDVCIIPVTFTPAKAGARSGAVQITGTISGVNQLLGTVYLNGAGNGSALAIDPGTNSILGSGSEPAGVATDSAGNAYVAYSNGTVYRTPNSGGTPVEIGSGLTNPHQAAIDGAGNLYVADSENGNAGAGEIIEFAGASTSSSVITGKTLIIGLTNPRGVAVDASGNLYIAETGNVLIQPVGNGMQTSLGSGFTTPVSVALDASGNVYVADTGLNKIVKLAMINGAVTQQSTVTLLSSAAPVSVAVDAAANIYYGDSSNGEVVEVPVSGTTAAVASGFTTPAIALDPRGNLYVADIASTSGISFYNRAAATLLPAIPMQRSGDATLTNAGNVSYTGGISGNSDLTASTDFTFAAGSSNGCSTPTSLTLAAGYNCDLNVTANTSTATDTVTFTGGSTMALSSQASEAVVTTTTLGVTNTLPISYGAAITGTVRVTPALGSLHPTGTVTFSEGTPSSSCTLANSTGNTSTCSFSLTGINAGPSTLTASYGGDSNNGTSSGGASLNIAQLSTNTTLNVTSSSSLIAGSTFTGTVSVTPTVATGTVSLYLNGSSTPATSCTLSSGSCSWSLSGVAIGNYNTPGLVATYGGSTNYATSSSSSTSISVTAPPQAPAVATGDTRTVTEPSFPAVCQQLTAAITSVNDDIPASVDATNSNPDGARIQAALNSCSTNHPGQAVELSVDSTGVFNAFLTGPLSMPSNVTLLVDPGVYVYFSRNAQDYDMVSGTHTCGTVNNNSATASCKPLIDIPGASTNVGIMGYGKLDGRGGDALLNAISPYTGQSWWGLATIANSGGSQQNPRFIQMDTGSSNITMYMITLRNAPKFHVSTTGAVNGFTAWDIKIITPTSSRNTDGIDPGNATNFTITRSWISDGDDNVAVGAAGSVPAANISVTNNRFFAGHGESIGSYTNAGVSNVLFDNNMSSGNGVAGAGSAVSSTGTFAGGTADSNSTGLRIKSGYDRGGVVSNIQYSNSCFQDHKAEIVFSPNYEATTGSLSPNLNNILMQNLTFITAGTAQFTGTSNGSTVYPLGVTLDNVSFPSTYPSSEFSPAPTNTALTYGPGMVSSVFASDYATFVGSNSNTATNNSTVGSLFPPSCNFTYIAPELTGPTGLPRTITQGQNATAVVILTPAVSGAAYPTGTVTLTDALTSNTYTATLPGNTDTISIPLNGLSVGTHTFTATYSGDSNYVGTAGVYTTTSPYVITVLAGSLSATTTSLGLPVSTSAFGTAITATATVAGSNPSGSVQFVVSGGGLNGSYTYATVALTSGTASASINLPYDIIAYSITAVYSGDLANAGSTSSPASLTVGAAVTQTSLSVNTASAALGNPIILTATVTAVPSTAGTPAAAPVTFAYSTTPTGTQTAIGTATTNSNGTTTLFVNSAPVGGPYYLFASYAGIGSYGTSSSTPGIPVTVTAATNIVQLSNAPIALPYTMTTIAGGGAVVPSSGNMLCTGATDKYGDGCQATAIAFTASDDMRAVVADPFGNVYLSDISATLVRRITPNGVISNFAGRVTGTACVPTATAGCTPTLVSIGKARGVGTDAAGNIYIANYTGNQIFEVKAADGLMYLVAGNGTAGTTGDGNAAASAEVNSPRGAWGDSIGNIYIAETAANKVRVVDTMDNIHTFAGAGGTTSTGDGGPATAANFNNPQGVFVDPNLNVYVTDSAGKIRVICVTCGASSPLDTLLGKLSITAPVNGNIYTIAGNGSAAAYTGTYPILATSVSMAPQKLSMDNSGNLYISDSNGFVWFLDFHTGYIRAIAANGTVCANKTDSYGDGCPATQASFGSNGGNGLGAGVDTQGNLYISDSTNGLIRKVITGLASPSTAVNAATTLPVQIHFVAGDTIASSNGLAYTSSEWTLGTPACTPKVDTTTDCLLTSSFTPAVPGLRSTPLTVNSSAGNKANLTLTGIGLGITITSYLPAAPTYGQTVTASATVTGSTLLAPTGNVAFYLDGSTTAITGTLNGSGVATGSLTGLSVGLHSVTATYTSSNGYPAAATSVSSSFTVGQATATITLGSLAQTYTGSPLSASATTIPSGMTVNFIYTGTGGWIYGPSSTAPTAAGSYTVAATISNTNYTGTASGILVISPATATITLGNLAQIYTGAPLAATATTNPPGLSVILTYNAGGNLNYYAPTAAGSYTVTGTINSAAGGQNLDYTGTATGTLVISPATATIKVTPYTVTYDGNAHTATGTATGVGGVNLASDLILGGTTHTNAGTYATDGWSFTDPAGNYAPASGTITDTINKAASSASLTTSLNPILLQNPVTYTATVSSTAGKPTGTVTFQDGGVAVSTCTGVSVTTATGLASCAVTYTATGTHSITALYSGDTNFLAAGPSNTVSEAAIDINLGTPSAGGGTTSSETILPGGAATYLFPIAPSSGATFPSPVTFTVTSSPALPAGTTITLTPSAWVYTSNNPWSWTLPASTSLTGTTVLTIQLPQTTASAQPAGGNLASRLAPFSLALLLLPFAVRLRKSGKRLGRMLAIILLAGAGAATLAGLSGCGSNAGFFAQAPQSCTVNVTVGFGSLSHTSTVTLTVE